MGAQSTASRSLPLGPALFFYQDVCLSKALQFSGNYCSGVAGILVLCPCFLRGDIFGMLSLGRRSSIGRVGGVLSLSLALSLTHTEVRRVAHTFALGYRSTSCKRVAGDPLKSPLAVPKVYAEI